MHAFPEGLLCDRKWGLLTVGQALHHAERGFRIEVEPVAVQPADTGTQGLPDHLGVLTDHPLMPAPAPVLGDRGWIGTGTGIGHMRQTSSQGC